MGLYNRLWLSVLLLLLAGRSGWSSADLHSSRWPRFVADPFEPRTGLEVAPGENELIGRIGSRLPIKRWHPGKLFAPITLSVGLAAYSWTWLGKQGSRFPVRAVDYLLGGYLQAGRGGWQLRLALNHISAHLGDAFFTESKPVRRPRTYSRELLQLALRKRLPGGELYTALQWAYHAIPEVNRWTVLLGATLRRPWRRHMVPYLAVHLALMDGPAGDARLTVQAGLNLPLTAPAPGLRWAVTWQSGPHLFGQFFDERFNRIFLGFFVDL